MIPDQQSLSPALTRKMREGSSASTTRLIASGLGWRVLDIACTRGPGDRPFEEHFDATSISLVVAGSFGYRGEHGSSLLSSGAFLLGNAGRPFECSHEHGNGDRCLSFQFDQELFERIAQEVGAGSFLNTARLPPLRDLAALSARAQMEASAAHGGRALACRVDSMEEIVLELAATVIRLANRAPQKELSLARHASRIANVLRYLESASAKPLLLTDLAEAAGLSRYHFLRTFKRVTGVTPHQWLLRRRLRNAAERLGSSREPITEIALDVGFDDLSNFIRSFRAEFGVSPRGYRTTPGKAPPLRLEQS